MLWIALGVFSTVSLERYLAHRRRVRAAIPPRDDPRWGDARAPRLAGRPCIECGTKIVSALDGAACEDCDAVAHAEICIARHSTRTHGARTGAAYRRGASASG